MTTQCPVCTGTDVQQLGRRSDLSDIKPYGRFVGDLSRFDRPIVRCNVCGMQFIHPRYDCADLLALYDQPGYQEFVIENAGCLDFGSVEMRAKLNVWKDQFVWLGVQAWKEVFDLAHDRRPTFLDVGCGRGRNLVVFDKLGFDVSGFDLSSDNVRFVKEELGYDVQQRSWEDLDEAESFDCILASHVIEHVDDPRRFFRNLHSVLSEDGIMIIETPRTDDRGDDRDRYRDIYHQMFFDTFTLTLLGLYSGLEIVRAHNIAFRRNQAAPNQVNVQCLFEPQRENKSVNLDAPILRVLRRTYDSVDADFLSFARTYLDRTSSNIRGALVDLGICHMRKHGVLSAVKYTCFWAIRELSRNLQARRKALSK